jgi:hypothetical protein
MKGAGIGVLNVVRQGHPSEFLLRGWLTGQSGHALGPAAVYRIQIMAYKSTNPSRWLLLHHDKFNVSYQLASRYWIYQGVGGAILIALALVCGFLTFRVVRVGQK